LVFSSHNGGVRKLAGVMLGALVLWTGCGTPSRQSSPRTAAPRPPDWENGLIASNPPVFTPVPAPITPAPEPIVPSAPPAPVAASIDTSTPWLALNRWLESQNLSPVQRVGGTADNYVANTPRGTLSLKIGSLVARWDQMEFRLGFAPQSINGVVFVHVLDVRKNIEPFLRGFVPNTNANRVVVIDPGHGGSNFGTSSVADVRTEKYYTLDWALRLAPLLEANGWHVLLTRTNDIDVSLLDRVAFAEAHRADLFLSLHFNSAGGGSREATGLETFCLTPVGMASSLTRGEVDDPTELFPNNAFDEVNVMYAAQIHAELLKLRAYTDRGVRRARFLTVLQGQNRPAVLIEGGFLSNAAEARRVADSDFRQKLAQAVADALK
jgi:N-acetylmuramoyl-L-alanine amidase